MSKRWSASLFFAAMLGLSLAGCGDSKIRVENEQLKAHVLQLQKDAGDLGNRIDVLTKENADLAAQIDQLKKKPVTRKPAKPKAHSKTSKHRSTPKS